VLDQGLRLFTAAPENEGIAALQAQHAFAGLGKIHQLQGYIALFRGWFATTFARIDQLSVCICPVQNRGANKGVIHNHIRLTQGIQGVQSQQARIAWACTTQPDPATL